MNTNNPAFQNLPSSELEELPQRVVMLNYMSGFYKIRHQGTLPSGSLLPRQTSTIPVIINKNSDPTPETSMTSENYWPNITDWISTGEGPKPLVKCVICHDTKLTIPGLQERSTSDTESDTDSDTDSDRYEAYHVLQCDHVFGAECLESWLRSKLEMGLSDNNGPGCPICREPVFTDQAELDTARKLVTQNTEAVMDEDCLQADMTTAERLAQQSGSINYVWRRVLPLADGGEWWDEAGNTMYIHTNDEITTFIFAYLTYSGQLTL